MVDEKVQLKNEIKKELKDLIINEVNKIDNVMISFESHLNEIDERLNKLESQVVDYLNDNPNETELGTGNETETDNETETESSLDSTPSYVSKRMKEKYEHDDDLDNDANGNSVMPEDRNESGNDGAKNKKVNMFDGFTFKLRGK